VSAQLSYFPAIAAGVIAAVLLGWASRLRRSLAVFVSVYVIIGCITYLYWIYVEAGPPHGSYVPSVANAGEIAWEFAVALAAIIAWPLWPVLRAIMLDM